ncbi:MAG TPA: hypothetical protein PKX57_08895 [Mesotoga sp.]|nr:hypothetical protein [Mesotoga sp.]
MKLTRIILIMLSLALFVLPEMILATEMETSCTVLFNDGQVIHAERFIRFYYGDGSSYSLSSSLGFVRTLESQTFSVKISDISKLELLDGGWGRNSLIRVTLRNGKADNLYLVATLSNLYVDYLDGFTGQIMENYKLDMSKITAVSFGQDIGNMKFNPITKQVFPKEFNFDPYTGEKLRFISSTTSAPFSDSYQYNTDVQSSNYNTYSEGTGKLTLVVTVGLTKIFFLTTHNLVVSIRGPVSKEQTFTDISAGSPVQVAFNDIPNGEYHVEAKWGDDVIAKSIVVNGDTVDFQMIIY